ncbi:hypothetical protein PDG61_16340 [Mycolicibacterium sp. BiH015]|uniref:hypothetical protein n=1 Tax=Mycolicibacterium sp. BiH015 TaxID=3018808 RepID=UPI0022E3746B|nr:hypothetical protein [Mycolicibacterium sp. BiH015]MDA2892491.1 hypothetical protein [Mycolicibacterium sp. BiH015]
MAVDRRPFWRSGTCSVWVEYDDWGSLVFHGDDSAYMGDPERSYEYWVTVAPQEFPKLRSALGGDPADDLFDLVCSRADTIMAHGERSWLDHQGIDRSFHCY